MVPVLRRRHNAAVRGALSVKALEVASQLLAGLRRDGRSGQAEQPVRPALRGDVERGAAVGLLEEVVDYELDRAPQGPTPISGASFGVRKEAQDWT